MDDIVFNNLWYRTKPTDKNINIPELQYTKMALSGLDIAIVTNVLIRDVTASQTKALHAYEGIYAPFNTVYGSSVIIGTFYKLLLEVAIRHI